MKYFIPLLIALLVSCSQGKNSAKTDSPEQQAESIELQMKKVMSVHDSIMPMMDLMHQMESALDYRIQELEANSEKPDKELLSAQKELEEASEAMMLWMSEFKPEEFEEDKAAMMEYLKEEEEKIIEVGDRMKNSMMNVQELLSEE